MTDVGFLRGIRKTKWLVQGVLAIDAFEPDPNTVAERRERNASPAGAETSISWDRLGARDRLWADKNASLAGIAKVSAEQVQGLRAKYSTFVHLEQDPLPDAHRPDAPPNPDHGNLVFLTNENAVKRAIQGALGWMATIESR